MSLHVDLVKRLEGLRLVAYKDQVGALTIGYGHTGPDVKPGMVITEARAEDLLDQDLDRAEVAVRDAVKVPLDDEHYAALVSFAYNIGIGSFRSSTLLRKLNAGDYLGAANELTRWHYATDKASGKKVSIPGLVKRREIERTLFLTGEVPEAANHVEPGSMTTADAAGGEHKPLHRSKTLISALFGGLLSAGLKIFADIRLGAPEILDLVDPLIVLAAIFAVIALIRIVEHRVGEH